MELPPSDGFTSIFFVVDRLTKMAHFIPMIGTPTPETAQAFIKEILHLYGVPSNSVSDHGVQFTSKFWKELCLALDIENHYSSACHPQTNGMHEPNSLRVPSLFLHLCPGSASVPAVWNRVEFLHDNLELLKDTMAKAQLDYHLWSKAAGGTLLFNRETRFGCLPGI